MINMSKLICVQGEEAKQRLLAAGLKLISTNGTLYTFLNDNKCSQTLFSEIEVVETDRLTF